MSGIPVKSPAPKSTDPVANAARSDASPLRPICWDRITRGIRNGDEECFGVLYDRFFDAIYRQVRSLTGRDESTCLDIVQGVLLKLVRAIKPIEEEAGLVAWIRVVTRTTTYDWLRKDLRKNAARVKTLEPEMLANAADRGGDPIEQRTRDAARLVWLEEQLRMLPAETRSMIALKYRVGWSLKRIGARFGMKTGAVDGRIRRAIEKIREQADRRSPDDY